MKKTKFAPFLALALGLLSLSAHAEATRLTNPNAINAELFGRGLRFGAGYDRVVSDSVAAGFTFGTTNLQTHDGTAVDTNAKLIAPFVNFYFTEDQSSLYVTGGAALLTNADDVKGLKSALGGLKFTSNSIIPQAGLGYENRGDSGFLFRMTAYVMADENVVPWVGFSFGYAF
jgi:hypothetical protein